MAGPLLSVLTCRYTRYQEVPVFAFIVGIICGIISGVWTFSASGVLGLAILVGVVCWFICWMVGVAIFTDGGFIDLDL